MFIKLKEAANVVYGIYDQPALVGHISYLQAKHFNDLGNYIGNTDAFLNESKKTEGNILQEGNVLFVSKGFRYFATLYTSGLGKAVASSVFFVIETNTEILIPAYLTIILNSKHSISYFKQLSAGSTIPSIRKSELLDFTFKRISLEDQLKVIKLYDLHKKQVQLTNEIIDDKQHLFEASISKLIY